MIKYKNYTIKRLNELNWTVDRNNDIVATKDITSPADPEIILYKIGDIYNVDTSLGFYGDVGLALNGVVRDLAGTDCKTIEELAAQISEIKEDLRSLLKESKKKI